MLKLKQWGVLMLLLLTFPPCCYFDVDCKLLSFNLGVGAYMPFRSFFEALDMFLLPVSLRSALVITRAGYVRRLKVLVIGVQGDEDGGLATALESLPNNSHQHIDHLSGECAARGSKAARLMGVDAGLVVNQYITDQDRLDALGLPCCHQEAAGNASFGFTSSGAEVVDHDSIVPPFEEVELKMAKIEAQIAAREASPNSASRIASDVERLCRKLVELKA
ncbi:hypothetical protein Nepgr_015846 [Nepenthes gracilis]|uniref:Uncharacterized protein n=1 Tax=Nepenthes gracilis TaxID=150966 RepID=A0AAD3SNK5_NEPGR|nr:hypothetical protein Nepgr_015846 [Nepenthes gracilis]